LQKLMLYDNNTFSEWTYVLKSFSILLDLLLYFRKKLKSKITELFSWKFEWYITQIPRFCISDKNKIICNLHKIIIHAEIK